jgi:putative colanic acid biosynthesis acetyltransferase WcaF
MMIDQTGPSCRPTDPPVLVTEPPRRSPWSARAKLVRVLWALVYATIWKIVPTDAARARLLAMFGAKIGPGVRIHRAVRIEIPWNLEIGAQSVVCRGAILYCLGKVEIGDRCLIGPFVHLCAGTHDYTDPRFTLLREPITIGDACVLMSDAFVAPSVTLAPGTVARPRAGIFKNTNADCVYAGNPAKAIEQEADA